ncbi:hypothetical protein CL3_30750 [butyrate-producing bacterium SM4/1]|nr:hypothetical protein CL3_30750 [butyrate-producing bacterium SM4/1]
MENFKTRRSVIQFEDVSLNIRERKQKVSIILTLM